MKDFVIRLAHSPGELADVTNALSLAGVNIKSLAAMSLGENAMLRLIPDDAAAYVGRTPETLARWRRLGTGPRYYRIGGEGRAAIFYLIDDLDAFISLFAFGGHTAPDDEPRDAA